MYSAVQSNYFLEKQDKLERTVDPVEASEFAEHVEESDTSNDDVSIESKPQESSAAGAGKESEMDLSRNVMVSMMIHPELTGQELLLYVFSEMFNIKVVRIVVSCGLAAQLTKQIYRSEFT